MRHSGSVRGTFLIDKNDVLHRRVVHSLREVRLSAASREVVVAG